jgi:hypothetical protein
MTPALIRMSWKMNHFPEEDCTGDHTKNGWAEIGKSGAGQRASWTNEIRENGFRE